MNKLLIALLLMFTFSFVSASSFQVWQGQYYIGTDFQTGIAEFNFTVYDSKSNGTICFTNTTNLTRGSFGEWKTEQSIGSNCSNSSIDYFLEIKIDDVLQSDVNSDTRRRLTLYDYLRRDVSDIMNEDLSIFGILRGASPLRVEESICFVNETDSMHFSLYHAEPGLECTKSIPDAFEDTFVIHMDEISNDYKMGICFWENETTKMLYCTNDEAFTGRGTTQRGSFQVVSNNITVKENDENFTLFEDYNFIDGIGADLGVLGDIEAKNIYANENITANNFIGSGEFLTNIAGVNESFNQSLTDEIYATIDEPLWSGNYTAYNSSWSLDTDTQKNASGYLHNDSTTIYLNETKINNTIDVRVNIGNYLNLSGDNANQDINISPYNFETSNLTITQKITFALGGKIENIVDGIIRVTSGMNILGNLNIGSYFDYNSTEGVLGIGIFNSTYHPFDNTNSLDKGIHLRDMNAGLVLEEIDVNNNTVSKTSMQSGVSFIWALKDEITDKEIFKINNDDSAEFNVSRFDIHDGNNVALTLIGDNVEENSTRLLWCEDSFENNCIDFSYNSDNNMLCIYSWTGGTRYNSAYQCWDRSGDDGVFFPRLSGNGNTNLCIDNNGKMFADSDGDGCADGV